MSLLSSHRVRGISAIGVSIACLVAAVAMASPAQAAIGVDLNASDTTITEGESVTLSWTSTDAIDLVAGGSWSGNKATPAGSEVVTPAGSGTFTYTLLATDADGRESSDEINIIVEADEVPANPMTVINGCDAVTFTNNTDGSLEIQYLWYDELSEETTEGGFTLAAGATDEIPREGPGGVWETSVASGDLNVPQNCDDAGVDDSDNATDHPEVAPVAGA